MRPFATDLRYSLRLLRKSPGFALIAIAALALGIGANTAIFSVIERVLLRPLPFPDSERIVQVRRQYPNGASSSISVPKFMAWRKCSAFQAVALYDRGAVTLNLGRGDRPDPISALHVTSQFFDVFGVKPMLGRTFTAQEDSPHAGNFVVLTFTAWKRTGGGTDIAGRAIELNGEPYAVLGVLPESYQPEPPADLYLPEQFDPNSTNQGHIYLMAGRLRPGVSMEAAKAELNVLGDQFRAEHPDFVDKNESVGIVPLRVAIGGDVRPALLILGGAVSFVLLIACANVANCFWRAPPADIASSRCVRRSAQAAGASCGNCLPRAWCSRSAAGRRDCCSDGPASRSCWRSARGTSRASTIPDMRPARSACSTGGCWGSCWECRS